MDQPWVSNFYPDPFVPLTLTLHMQLLLVDWRSKTSDSRMVPWYPKEALSLLRRQQFIVTKNSTRTLTCLTHGGSQTSEMRRAKVSNIRWFTRVLKILHLELEDTHGIWIQHLSSFLCWRCCCSPGRFFAANQLKAMLAHVAVTYDVKMELEGVIPDPIIFGFLRVPDPKTKVMFRKRRI